MTKRAIAVVPWYAPRRKRRRTTKFPRRLLSSPEVKFDDTTLTSTLSHFEINCRPSQGDDGNDFIGSKINLHALDVTHSTTGSSANNRYRVSVLIPKDPSTLPTSLNVASRYDQHDFHILYDEFYTAEEKTGTRFRVNLTGKAMEFNQSGTTVLKNNIYVVINSASSQNQTLTARLYYTDP